MVAISCQTIVPPLGASYSRNWNMCAPVAGWPLSRIRAVKVIDPGTDCAPAEPAAAATSARDRSKVDRKVERRMEVSLPFHRGGTFHLEGAATHSLLAETVPDLD